MVRGMEKILPALIVQIQMSSSYFMEWLSQKRQFHPAPKIADLF